MNSFELLLTSSPMRALGWTLLHFLWQGVLLFAVHEVVQLVLRRHRAALRYVAACAVLCTMLASALFTLSSELQRASVGAGEVRAQATRLDTSAQSAFRTAREGATPPVVASTPSDPHARSIAGGAGDADAPAAATDPLARTRAFLQSRFPSLETSLPWLVSLWFAGVFLLTTRLAIGWQEARWLRTRAVRPVTQSTRRQVRALLHRLRISRPVQVLESSLAEVPTVVGWLRPVVLLPTASLTGLPPQHLEALLAHELSHVRRHDYLVNLLQTLVETMLFYHPAVWWVSRRIRDERENCCDDAAVRLCGDAVLYARALTRMEELRRGPLQPELAMAADGGSLVQRVRRVVGRGGEPDTPGAGVVVGALLLGLSSLLAVSAARTAESTVPVDAVPVTTVEPTEASGLPGGKIAGFTEAQPAPQLPRPVSSSQNPPDPQPAAATPPEPRAPRAPEPQERPQESAGRTTQPVFTLEEIVQLEQHEVDTAFYDRMTALFGPLDVEEIVALKVHEIDERYVRQMFEQLGRLDVEELLALRVHDIDVDTVREMSRSFERRVEVDEVVRLSQVHLDREDIDEYHRHGVHLEPSELAALHACGVDAEDLEEMQDLGLRDASMQDLARAAQAGIDADDLEELQSTLGSLRLEDGVALLLLGVDGNEIEELQDMGMHHPRVDELLRMYSQGLTADVIDTILDDRMDQVPVEALLLFKELGLEDVFLAEFRRRNE